MNIKKCVIFLVLLIPVFASCQATCPADSNVYFVNGVNKPSEKEIVKDVNKLTNIVKSYSIKAANIQKVDYLYNDSDGLMLDTLYELAAQKAAERNGTVADYFLSVGFSAFGLIGPLSDADQLEVRRKVAKVISQVLPEKTQALVSQFSSRVANESLNAGLQAILIPHSQGNMFANAVFDNLKLALPVNIFRGLGVVGVASPASWAPSGLYQNRRKTSAVHAGDIRRGSL